MDGFTLEDLRLVVEHSSVCFGVFHEKTSKITAPNAALRLRLEAESFSVQVVSNEDGKLHGRLEKENIPVSLQVLTGMDPSGGCLVEVYLANSKSTSDNSPTSDLIQLVDMTSDGVWEWFPSLQYEFMSERFWSILGYDHRDMPSSPDAWMSIIDPGDLTIATKMYNDHVATKGVAEYNCNVSYTHKQGHEVQVKCRGAVVEWLPDGSPWRLLGTHTDITEITEAVDAKARFVSRMSHEIRTPICAILNECEMLEQNAATSVIADSCDQLLALCNDILTVSKLRKPMAMAAFRRSAVVGDFFHKAVRRHSGQAQKKGLTLKSHALNVPDVPLMMDVSKCNQVVDNLVSNAIKYTEPGGQVTLQLNCTLSDSPTEDGVVSLRVRDTNKDAARKSRVVQWQVEIIVSDTGKGIHKDDVDFVFAKFSQANSSMQGAGLGLPISKELAQLMSGDVYLTETVPGKGSTFCFTFPATVVKPAVEEPAPVTDGEESTDASVESREMNRSTIRILSADDMLTNRKIMRRRLRAIEEQLGNVTVEVIDAVNGREAVRTFREEGKFDLIFMDCLMPEMDGFQASKEIHRLCEERGIHRVPVVAVTASVSTGLHEECREAGIEQVVTKPFGAMELMPILHFAIDNQRDLSPSSPATSKSRSTASAESSPGEVVPPLQSIEGGSAKPSTKRSYVRAKCVSPSPCPRALPSGSGGSSREGVFSFLAGSVRADRLADGVALPVPQDLAQVGTE